MEAFEYPDVIAKALEPVVPESWGLYPMFRIYAPTHAGGSICQSLDLQARVRLVAFESVKACPELKLAGVR